LKAEITFVLERMHGGEHVLELGCGYGRVLIELAKKAGLCIGIDTSGESLSFSGELFGDIKNCFLLEMDALHLSFKNRVFDRVICIQNGISAFHVNPHYLIREAIRVLKPGGSALFSSYSGKFWNERLKWFEMQSKEGLVGKIDYEKTGKGTIVCKDGFTATTFSEEQFRIVTKDLSAESKIEEVDESSIFCEINLF